MTAKSFRTPAASALWGIHWIGASNEIANSAIAANGPIPSNWGKNNRDFTLDQSDIDYSARLVSSSLGWSSPVEALWGAGRMLDGSPSTGPHLAPAEVCAAALTDAAIGNVGVILHAQGGAGIDDYANGAPGTAAKTWFDSRIADAPGTFFMRALPMGMGFPDMQTSGLANSVQANLDTIVQRYRDSGVPGAGSFHAFLFAHHSDFGPDGSNPQPFYETVVEQSIAWANSDPRNHYVTTQDILILDRTVVSVAAPSFGLHWGPTETVDRGSVMPRAIVDAFAQF